MGVPDSLKGPTVAKTTLAFVARFSKDAGSDRSAVISGTSYKMTSLVAQYFHPKMKKRC